MRVDDNIIIDADCNAVLDKLRSDLKSKQIPYLSKIIDSGNDIMVQCPYHGDGQEKRPSAGIRKSDGLLHCFACGAVHSLPETISYCYGKDDGGAYGATWLVRNFVSVEHGSRRQIPIDVSREHSVSYSPVEYVSDAELNTYRYHHPYWADRGIVDDIIIELFDLGYDAKTDSITFPVRDSNGNCLFVARRSVQHKFFNYPSGVEKPLYGLYELSLQPAIPKEVFITESMIDCILLWQAGYIAVALNGTGSELQYRQLRLIPCRKFIIATDGDRAGMQARYKLRQVLKNRIVTEIDFPPNRKDIGECTPDEIAHIKQWEIF